MDVTHRLHSGHSGSMSVKGCPQRQEQSRCLQDNLGREVPKRRGEEFRSTGEGLNG